MSLLVPKSIAEQNAAHTSKNTVDSKIQMQCYSAARGTKTTASQNVRMHICCIHLVAKFLCRRCLQATVQGSLHLTNYFELNTAHSVPGSFCASNGAYSIEQALNPDKLFGTVEPTFQSSHPAPRAIRS